MVTYFIDFCRWVEASAVQCERQHTHLLAFVHPCDRDEFKTLDYQRIYDNMAKPAFVFDGRGVVDIKAMRKIGFEVYCIGKSEPKYSLDSK